MPGAAATSARPHAAIVPLPCCALAISTDAHAVTGTRYLPRNTPAAAPADPVAERAVREVERYLDDPSYRFGVPLAYAGSPFQRRVWDAIAALAAGAPLTYGELARRIDGEARAVGQACGANPIPLFIPCHRVVAAGGALGGFMGRKPAGRDAATPDLFAAAASRDDDRFDPSAIKRWLLAHEAGRSGR